MLTFVIPTYNEEAHIEKLLGLLGPQLEKGDEIIIVDSYSKDNTVKIARKYGARVVMQPKKGNGLARTAGAKNAKNDVVVFVDADSEPSKDFAKRIRKHFGDEKLLAVGGLDLYHSDSQTWKFIYDTFSKSIFYSAWLAHSLTGKYWLASNNCAFRKHVFLRAGGYRSVICEDTDLTSRLPPSKHVKYDKHLKLSLSDRRFKKDGFLNTLKLWAWGNMTAAVGKGVDSSQYKKS
jgi:glycosyltransferase involved in cell wall biosynthesis